MRFDVVCSVLMVPRLALGVRGGAMLNCRVVPVQEIMRLLGLLSVHAPHALEDSPPRVG